MSILIAVLLVSAQAAAAPQAVASAQTTAPAAAKPAKPKKICKVDDADSGSHMVRRVCRTAEEWAQSPLGNGHSGTSLSGEAMQGH